MYTSVSARAAASYRQASATGASPHQIVALLFDALTQALHSALDGIDRNDAETKALQAEIRALKERIQVLERIATDTNRAASLDEEIERLRDRSHP